MSMVTAHTFQHIAIPVNDLVRARVFYLNVLGLHVESDQPPRPNARQVRMYAGDRSVAGQQVVLFLRAKPVERDSLAQQVESLRLVEAGDVQAGGELVQDGRTHHAWVITPEEFEAAPGRLKELGIPYCAAVPRGRGGAAHAAIYFFDPDGNQIQLTDHL